MSIGERRSVSPTWSPRRRENQNHGELTLRRTPKQHPEPIRAAAEKKDAFAAAFHYRWHMMIASTCINVLADQK